MPPHRRVQNLHEYQQFDTGFTNKAQIIFRKKNGNNPVTVFRGLKW
jgi:hypothetical protein